MTDAPEAPAAGDDGDHAAIERAIKAECDALAGEASFCFFPRCDCAKLPDEVKRRRGGERREG